MRPLFFCLCAALLCSTAVHAQSAEDDSAKKPSGNKADTEDGPRWFSLRPGVNLHSIALAISGNHNDATMTQPGAGDLTYLLDVKSKEFQLGPNYGIHFLLHTGAFTLNRQFIEQPSTGGSSGGGSSSSGSGRVSPMRADDPATGTSSNTERVNMGTQIQGYYTYAIPVFYVGSKNPDGWRAGIGAGPATVRLQGSTFLNNPVLKAVAPQIISNRTGTLDAIAAFYVSSGLMDTHDPYAAYLISNLSQGNNLDTLGQYLLFRGQLRLTGDALIFAALLSSYRPANLTPAGALALFSIGRGYVSVKKNGAFAWMAWVESASVGGVKFRLGFGGPTFAAGPLHYEFRVFDISAFYPIAF